MERKKILLVDDSTTLLAMEKMILRKEAYEVVTASNGEEAVEKALAEKPALIVMDVIMPKMNGFEACEKLRALAETRDIPIIMLTTRSEEKNIETAYRSGCNDYVLKPINSIELITKIKSYLGE